ncbi:MAG: hypothetical protein IRZ32_02710 [Solirubrobacteraceae bacterium]|nr:hypothetical protein [Solirubrobacteraceae bacterium]
MVAQQRVVGGRVAAPGDRAQEDAEAPEPLGQVGRQPERGGHLRRDLVDRARRQHRRAQLGVQRREHLLGQEAADRVAGVGAGGAERDAERPAERRLHELGDLVVAGLAPEPAGEHGGGLVGAEREVGLPDEVEAAARLGAGDPDVERPAGADDEPQAVRLAVDDLLEEVEHVAVPLELLGVVEDEHERLDEERLQLVEQRAGHVERAERLARRADRLHEQLGGARHGPAIACIASTRSRSTWRSRARQLSHAAVRPSSACSTRTVFPYPAPATSPTEPRSIPARTRSASSGRSMSGAGVAVDVSTAGA